MSRGCNPTRYAERGGSNEIFMHIFHHIRFFHRDISAIRKCYCRVFLKRNETMRDIFSSLHFALCIVTVVKFEIFFLCGFEPTILAFRRSHTEADQRPSGGRGLHKRFVVRTLPKARCLKKTKKVSFNNDKSSLKGQKRSILASF